MPLTQTNRESISKQNLEVPEYIKSIFKGINLSEKELLRYTNLDNAYKAMFNDVNAVINSYQLELSCISCVNRNTLNESHFINAIYEIQDNTNPLFYSSRFLQNYKFPYIKGFGIGLAANGSSPGSHTNCESVFTGNITTAITTFDGAATTTGQKSTGQSCAGGGTITTNSGAQTAMTNLITQVQRYRDFLAIMRDFIFVSSEYPTRNTESQAAKNSVIAAIANLDAWLALTTFSPVDTSVAYPGGCTAFDLIDTNTKGKATNITNLLSNTITTRTSFNPTRTTQLNSYLGTSSTISQDTSFGNIPILNSSQRQLLYYERAYYCNARVNLNTGVLRLSSSTLRAIREQFALIGTYTDMLSAGDYYIAESRLLTLESDTDRIRVFTPSLFNIGDIVYVLTDNLTQMSCQVLDKISPHTLVLNRVIPATYTRGPNSRVYKIIKS